MGTELMTGAGLATGAELIAVERAGDVAECGTAGDAGCGAVRRRDQRGMVSAEWAVGIIAAVALAGVLIIVITNGPVQDALLKFILEVIKSFSGFVR